ncbi:hypothetical protein FSARC_934 [Fusarium sarcochroum]|uniref:Nudix hydrolase domain-containing protein n=1 Tax=Fusarium sarcochroum TaxID=1208366 RepID=A0A8H4U9Y5_9HYPO|nr:hypothetical protein FSARC_934 [Fusarium sarcochroum]
MAGLRQSHQQRIVVRPSVWIRITDEAIHNKAPWKKLKKEVEGLGLNSPEHAAIYVEGGLRLAHDSVAVPRQRLNMGHGIEFPNGFTLHTHVAMNPFNSSACGLACLATIVLEDTVVYQQVSRIGGVIGRNSISKLEVTSGHVMLQHFLQGNEKPSGPNLGTSPNITFGPDPASSIVDEEESDDDIELVENDHKSDSRTQKPLGKFCPEEVEKWVTITPSGTINFINQADISSRTLKAVPSFSMPSIAADFALVSGMNHWQEGNSYTSRGVKRMVDDYSKDLALTTEEVRVLILLGVDEPPAAGLLLPSKIALVIDGATFWTRKVSLGTPLSRGTSGSWVVKSDSGKLCGSVIAVFDQEPYALMITSETLFSDIKKFSRDISSIQIAGLYLRHLPEEPLAKLDRMDEGVEIEPDKIMPSIEEDYISSLEGTAKHSLHSSSAKKNLLSRATLPSSTEGGPWASIDSGVGLEERQGISKQFVNFGRNVTGVDTQGVRLMASVVPLTPDSKYVLLIQSTQRKGWTLPEGSWKNDETNQESAERVCWEEAGTTIQFSYDLGIIQALSPSNEEIKDWKGYRFYEGIVIDEYDD